MERLKPQALQIETVLGGQQAQDVMPGRADRPDCDRMSRERFIGGKARSIGAVGGYIGIERKARHFAGKPGDDLERTLTAERVQSRGRRRLTEIQIARNDGHGDGLRRVEEHEVGRQPLRGEEALLRGDEGGTRRRDPDRADPDGFRAGNARREGDERKQAQNEP